MGDEQFFKQQTETNVFVQLMQRYMPFWPLFIFTTGLSLAFAYVYLRSQIPTFVASAKVLLEDPNKGSSDSKVLDALNIFGDKKIVDNEIVVLKSTNLMQEVVSDLNLYASVYNRGRVRDEEVYKESSPIWFIASQPGNVYPGKEYFFKVDWNKQQLSIDNRTVHFNDSILINNAVYRIVPNPAYIKRFNRENYFVQFNSVEGAAADIIGHLTANAISNQSTVIDMRLETPVPQKGVDILAKLFQVYNKTGIENKNKIAAQTLAFIEDRLGLVTSQLDSVETNVQEYKKKHDVIDLSAQGQAYLDRARDYDKSKSQIEMQLDVLNDIDNYINSKDKKSSLVPSLTLLNDPTLPVLLAKLYDAEFQLDKIRSVSGEKSDAVKLSQQEVGQLQSDIKENVTNIRKNLLSARNNINSTIGTGTEILNQIPDKERGLLDVMRQQSIKTNIVAYLLQKREETELNSAGTIADLRVVERAAYYGPIKPIAKNYYITGIVIGILLAVFIILVREQFNRKVLFRTEIEQKTKVPVIGEIVQVDTKDPVVIREGKRTIIAEQFRSLRTNLSFMALSEDAKTTLVTSNISGEGKSFVSINLAISYTLTDKKVALLELDLRKPRLSKLLNVNRDPGISNYLVGKIPINEIIKETSINNLFIISAGAIPPNPSELILSSKFKELLTQLKARFDILIIDSAPVGPVSDSLLLKDYADATIFVVRHNATPKTYLKQIDNLNQQKIFKNMCIVFNGLKRRGIGGAYGYGYGNYGYGYGNYGYGYGDGGGGYYVEEKRVSFLSGVRNLFRK